MPNILLIVGVEITLAKRQIIDGIKDICFSNAITSNKAINFFRKLHFGSFVIFKIDEFKGLQVHKTFVFLQKYNLLSELRNLIYKVAKARNYADVIG